MRRPGPLAAVAVGVALSALLLSGCGPAREPDAVASPTVSDPPAPIPTETVDAEASPSSRFEFGCDDFAEAVGDLLGGPVRLQSTVPTVEARPSWLEGPAQHAIAQAGGLTCEFRSSASGSAGAASVFVVADGADALEARAEVYGPDEEAACTSIPDGFSCAWADLAAGSYVELRSTVPITDADEAEARLTAAIDGIRGYVVALPATGDTWRMPADAAALRGGCVEIMPPEALADALGSDELAIDYPAGGWSIESWAVTEVWDALPCYYYAAAADPYSSSVGALTFLPGGAWAFDSAVRGSTVTVPGGDDDDRAVVACGASESWACTVDVVAGGTWVRWSSTDEPDDPDAYARRIAETIVAGVRG